MKVLPALTGALCLLLCTPSAAQAYRVTVWDRLADCESGDSDGLPPYRATWNYNGSSNFDGGLQFHPNTWSTYRKQMPRAWLYPAYAWQAPRWKQICVALRVLWDQGWGAWPACSRKLGLR